LRRTIGATIKLETDLAPDLPGVQGDRGQIEQLLMNLAVNARDAMRGGGTLRIATSEPLDDRLHPDDLTRASHIRLTVSDTGCGMSPEVAARAFEPFYTTKNKGEGSGLGLTTVYGIVTQAGGNIVISSEPGVGTNVEVMLPATDAIVNATPEVPSRRSLAASGETILLVEDEEIVREPTRRILANNGYTVLVAASAEQAIHTAANHEGAIDLLLTDVVMPGRSGSELMADVHRARPSTKVLYMSGYTFDVTAGKATFESDIDLIQKPFDTEDLLRRLREVLEG
jgi:CheY-like chemotaxis protein